MTCFFSCVSIRPWQLPTELIKQNVFVIGEIVSIPKKTVHADSFTVALNQFEGHPVKTKIQLSWYGNHPMIKVGDLWSWSVRLKPPHGLSNPGGRNWHAWFSHHAITATGYIVQSALAKKIGHQDNYPLLSFRQKTVTQIQKIVPQHELAAILAALTVGVREPLSIQQWKVFQRTGTSHLMAVSGLHVALIAMVVYRFSFWCYSRFPYCLLKIPALYIATVMSLVAAWGYALLSGWGVPAQRACIMLSCVLIGDSAGGLFSVSNRIVIALLIIVLLRPSAVFTASFWLSFSAVAWMALAVWRQSEGWSRFTKAGSIQVCLFMGLLPFSLYDFGLVSWLGVLVNGIAIPWVSIVVLPCALLSLCIYHCCSVLGTWLLQMTADLLLPLWFGLCHISYWSYGVWYHVIGGMTFIFILLAALVLIFPGPITDKGFAIFLLLPLLFPHQQKIPVGDVVLTVLDVGQGLAVVAQTAHRVLVYDTGPYSYGGFDAGQQVVVPYLRYQHKNKIDTMMISHGDNDHIGGAPAVLQAFPVDRLLTSMPEKLSSWPAHYCHQGQSWRWDEVDFTVLWPPLGMVYAGNNSSCVLKISAHNQSILLTGDIEQSVEKKLLMTRSTQLSAVVLVAPHHGSKTSSTEAFVTAVEPRVVIYPQGYYNRYHFPAKEVVARYAQHGVVQYKTSDQGAITVRLMAKGKVELSAFVHS